MKIIAAATLLSCLIQGALADDQPTPTPTPFYAYWHDGFGKQRSHGCINLAPRDARWLYYWSDPIVPPGWTATTGVVEAPGSIVRVRSVADPMPAWRGYAKKVAEARTHRNAE